jgi:hypothetical protein
LPTLQIELITNAAQCSNYSTEERKTRMEKKRARGENSIASVFPRRLCVVSTLRDEERKGKREKKKHYQP